MDFSKAYDLIIGKLITWMDLLIKMLPNLLLAAVVLVIGIFIAKYIRRLSMKLIAKVSHNTTLNSLFASVVYVVAIGIVLFTSLTILNLDKAVTTILAGAGVLGLGLAFAFQDIAANFMSGIFISFRKPINIDDIVEIKGFLGRVKEINLRDTVVQTFTGHMVIIPNKEVFQNPIENFSLLGKRRMDLAVGVSYGDDLDKVKKISLDAVAGIEGLSEDESTLYFTEFGDSSINFTIRLWSSSADQPHYLKVKSDAIMSLKAAFDKNDIMIPFPIRTLDFGIKGGEKLDQMELGKFYKAGQTGEAS